MKRSTLFRKEVLLSNKEKAYGSVLHKHKPRFIPIVLIFIGVLAYTVFLFINTNYDNKYYALINAEIENQVVSIKSDYPGNNLKLNVKSGDLIRAGQLLGTYETRNLDMQIASSSVTKVLDIYRQRDDLEDELLSLVNSNNGSPVTSINGSSQLDNLNSIHNKSYNGTIVSTQIAEYMQLNEVIRDLESIRSINIYSPYRGEVVSTSNIKDDLFYAGVDFITIRTNDYTLEFTAAVSISDNYKFNIGDAVTVRPLNSNVLPNQPYATKVTSVDNKQLFIESNIKGYSNIPHYTVHLETLEHSKPINGYNTVGNTSEPFPGHLIVNEKPFYQFILND